MILSGSSSGFDMNRLRNLLLLASSIIGSGVVIASVPSQPDGAGTIDAQLTRGRNLYLKNCAECHGATFNSGKAPQLAGESFRNTWKSKDARALYRRILSTMPATDPGSLTEQEVLDITSYLLKANGAAVTLVTAPGDLDHKPLAP